MLIFKNIKIFVFFLFYGVKKKNILKVDVYFYVILFFSLFLIFFYFLCREKKSYYKLYYCFGCGCGGSIEYFSRYF